MGAERQHGTRVKYVQDHCRCFACKVANANYASDMAARQRGRAPWRVHHIYPSREWIVRNQLTGEIDGRFPFDDPAGHQDAYERRETLNTLAARESDVDPLWADGMLRGEVKKHLRKLQRSGLGLRRVAELAGVSRTRLTEFVNDTSYNAERPRRRWLKYETAQRILATLPNPSLPAGAAVIPGRETHRLLEELLAAGMSRAAIARGLGYKAPALQLKRKRVLKRNADAVRAFHDRVWRANDSTSARLRAVCRCPEWERSTPLPPRGAPAVQRKKAA